MTRFFLMIFFVVLFFFSIPSAQIYAASTSPSIIIESGPLVRIPGITVPTVLRLDGVNGSLPRRWLRSGTSGYVSPTVTIAGTYYAEVNYSTEEANPFWVQVGSITIPELSHTISISGTNGTLDPVIATTLCLSTNASQYVTSRNWIFNGRDQFGGSSDPACVVQSQPGTYVLQVTYHFGGQSVTANTLSVTLNPSPSAPGVSLNKTT